MDPHRLNREKLARIVVALVIVVVSAAVGISQIASADDLVILASMPENGGWQPDVIRAQVGVPLALHFTSSDVMHGFAIGKMEGAAVEVVPGEVSEIELVFDQSGTYTFYCTRWCGPNHWRMRGTIEVEGGQADQTSPKIPLYLQLSLDLDAQRKSEVLPPAKPSATRGEPYRAFLPSETLSQASYRSHSPVEVFQDLRSVDAFGSLDDQQLWDLVTYLAWEQTSPAELLEGQKLYQANCAACHGESGAGDGVFADPSRYMQPDSNPDEHALKIAANFTDPETMLAASPALLQGKIWRGGMGTGMPSWGLIFTEQQTWSLVNYLWTFQYLYPVYEP